jgi:DNA-binding response OmpR family regulator
MEYALMHEHSRLLLIEDDRGLATVITEYLTEQQIRVSHANSAATALVNQQQFDLILCDIMLPDASGLDLLKQLQQRWSCPVLFLTALSSEQDQICGLEAGAADYLCKPIDPSLLLARIRSALRLARKELHQSIKLHDLVLDRTLNQAFLAGNSLQMTNLEFDILWFFASHHGKVVHRDLLFKHIVGRDYDGLDRAIDLKISRLRRKIEELAVQGLAILTVRGQGYLFHYHKDLPQG